jgi:hypothetical protein
MEVSNINNILFLPALHIYLDSIIRMYQSPGTTEIPYEKIAELCTGKITPEVSSPKKKTGTKKAKGAAAAAVAETMAESESGAAAAAAAADEEQEEVMPEIVPVIKKPTASMSASAIAPPVVFGFEAEVPKEEEIDLFDLLQDDDDDDDRAGDSAPSSAQFGGLKGNHDDDSPERDEHSDADADADAYEDSDEEDLSDITGMELSNPNPFSKRIQERDPRHPFK